MSSLGARPALPLLVMICLARTALAGDVIVEGSKFQGQGILAFPDGSCLVVAPLHICEDPEGEPCPQVKIYRKRMAAVETGTLHKFQKGWEFSVYALPSASPLCSPREFRFGSDVSKVLSRSSVGMLKRREPDGSRYQVTVEIQSYDDAYIVAVPLNHSQTVDEGFSGSALVVDGGSFVGIVLSVNDGTATIARLDHLKKVLSSIFDTNQADSQYQSRTVKQLHLGEERDLLAATVTIELLRSNPRSPSSQATLVVRDYATGRIDRTEITCTEREPCTARIPNLDFRIEISNVSGEAVDLVVDPSESSSP